MEDQQSQPSMSLIEGKAFEPQEMGGHGNEAGSFMTFFLMLNLGN
jgi:hypothetical protein